LQFGIRRKLWLTFDLTSSFCLVALFGDCGHNAPDPPISTIARRVRTELTSKVLPHPPLDMLSTRPCAAFEPISPDFDVAALVETTPNFEYAVRIHCDMIDHQGLEKFEKLVLLHVILGGKPLVIEGYQDRLDRRTFALQWLRDNCASKGGIFSSYLSLLSDRTFS
jgi:hypothetical protein